MQKLPIFTLAIVLSTVLLGFAQAWQESGTQEGSTADSQTSSDADQQIGKLDPALLGTADPEAVNVLRDSREMLYRSQSLKAKLEQTARFGELAFNSSGTYLSAEGYRYRIEFEVLVGDMSGRFLEVCDGQLIHTRREIGKVVVPGLSASTPPTIDLTRRDIQAILQMTQKNVDQPLAVHAAEIGLGGLTSVLASLERTMNFDALREGTLNERPIIEIQGRWKSDERDQLLSTMGTMAGQFTAFLPDMVRVAFDKETKVPVRFMYLQLASERRKAYRPILTVELKEVVLNGPVNPDFFSYGAPTGIEERDETQLFLNQIAALEGEEPAQLTDPNAPPAETKPDQTVPMP